MTDDVPVSELLHDGDVDVRELPAEFDLIEFVRDTAAASDHGLAWCLHLDIEDRQAPSLTFGMNGRRGFASWWNGHIATRSAGSNSRPADYWSGGHHFQIDPYTEIDAEHVYAALGEFMATHARPRCIWWNDQQTPAA